MNTAPAQAASSKRGLIAATAVATVFEWYDFYLCTILAPYFAKIFFPLGDETHSFLAAFTAYALGFAVRPFGALIFGHFGDTLGRKYTFIFTIVFMGLTTFTIGLLPTYAQAGAIAPSMLVAFRIVQGIALGGEFGGAALYVAEFVSARRRGFSTSLIQVAPTIGFLTAVVVINASKSRLTEEEFMQWGWRIAFLLSIVLLFFSMYLRLILSETPVFRALRANRQVAKSPIRETFAWPNAKRLILSLVGCGIGQGAVANAAQFYSLFFVTITLQIELAVAFKYILIASIFGMVLVPACGWLCDKFGRLRIMFLGFVLAAVAILPAFHGLLRSGNPDLAAFRDANPVAVRTDTSQCGFHLFAGPWSKYSTCDYVRSMLANSGLSFRLENSPGLDTVELSIGSHAGEIQKGSEAEVRAAMQNLLFAAGYPGLNWKYINGEPQTTPGGKPILEKTGPNGTKIDAVPLMANLLLIVLMAALVYGPVAAFLSEYFPARIRYTSVSLIYHVSNGWFGGIVQVAAAAMVAATGDIFAGLWYVMAGATLSLIVGLLFLRDQSARPIES
jgi:MFS family permease